MNKKWLLGLCLLMSAPMQAMDKKYRLLTIARRDQYNYYKPDIKVMRDDKLY